MATARPSQRTRTTPTAGTTPMEPTRRSRSTGLNATRSCRARSRTSPSPSAASSADGATLGTPVVDGAVAVVVDAVAADLRRARVDGGVVVAAVVAPGNAVAVPILTAGALFARDEALQVLGSVGDQGAQRRDRHFEIVGRCPFSGVVGDRRGDLRGPGVDPAKQ